jgi:hypothetical protein
MTLVMSLLPPTSCECSGNQASGVWRFPGYRDASLCSFIVPGLSR